MSERRWDADEVSVEVSDDKVAVLTLRAPKRRNALTPNLVDEICGGVDFVESCEDAAGALVIAAEGPAFCAGAALGQLDAADEQVLRRIYTSFTKVRGVGIPTIAAVGGPAVGAGLNLAFACDMRVVSPAAIFDSRFVKIGLHPGGGATWLLRQAVGQSTATAMLLFGETISGNDAVGRGLAWACAADEDLLATARGFAAAAVQAPAELTSMIKRSLRDTVGLTHPEALEFELIRQVETTKQPWYQAIRAASSAPKPVDQQRKCR